MPSPLVAIVAGVGRGTGSAIALKFASQYSVVCLARNAENYNEVVSKINTTGGKAIGISTDLTSKDSVIRAFCEIEKEFGKEYGLAAAIFNASTRPVRKPFLELTELEFTGGYEVLGRGGFLFAQSTLPHLLESVPKSKYPPSLIFTGATASIKSSAQFVSFSNGKWALRSLAQSLAKEFGPKGVHVSHAIIDGVIGIPSTLEGRKDIEPDTVIAPEAIADTYWYLHTQHRSAFSWEIDIRPFKENW